MTVLYRQNPRTAGRVIEGQAFVVTPDDSKLHTLNRTGTRIWVMAERGCSLDDIAVGLAQQFEVTPEQARVDAETFVSDLVARGVLVES